MGLLDTFKKIFGLDDTPYVLTHEQRILPKPVLTVEPVMITPKVNPVVTLVLYNKDSLSKLSKHEIAELASKELGIEINTKLKKDEMIKAYLTAQKG